jgi:hypothetical protein
VAAGYLGWILIAPNEIASATASARELTPTGFMALCTIRFSPDVTLQRLI